MNGFDFFIQAIMKPDDQGAVEVRDVPVPKKKPVRRRSDRTRQWESDEQPEVA